MKPLSLTFFSTESSLSPLFLFLSPNSKQQKWVKEAALPPVSKASPAALESQTLWPSQLAMTEDTILPLEQSTK